MADVKTDKEPSIEEILESIRQIISEDGEKEEDNAPEVDLRPVAQAPDPGPPPAPTPKPAPKPVEEPVIDLTDKVEKYTSDLDLSVQPQATEDAGALLADTTAAAATDAMAKLLAGNVAVERADVPGRVGNVTLEDMARELMRPLIKTWLDQNLPGVIEKLVQKEIDKISKRAASRE